MPQALNIEHQPI